ncbi:serine--tRNA ligase-like [Aricia agestis]|uniref:serine--tRNA ligase-like n=1 Tax=Aricia agestis TaxID=91739 RepID=UPI001C205EBC|nr:serine--tRNA ligase-like [Aricia agestis]
MLRKIIPCKILADLSAIKIQPKRSSTLFMNGPKATDNFMYVTPYVDYSEYLSRKNVLQEELVKRQANNNLIQLENLWGVYEELKKKKTELTDSKNRISKELGQNLNTDNPDIEKLRLHHTLLKENISKFKVPFWSAEEAAIIEYLKLPNRLHPLTPTDKNKVIFDHGSPPSNQKNHMHIGKELDLVCYNNNTNYYLKSDAAIFELGSKFYFSNILRNNHFDQFSNPDFCKSFIVEGCGGDPSDPNSTYTLDHHVESDTDMDNRLHLTGSGAMTSFFAYHTKNVVQSQKLPLKYFSMGRQYTPTSNKENSLFNVCQSSVIQAFMVAKNLEEIEKLMQELINILKVAYTDLGYHFRLSFVPAKKLKSWESLRIAIEMYSSSLKSYIEIGNLSMSEDFISKRLMFTYLDGKEHKFPFVMSGTLLNVPRLFACTLEQDGTFSVPPQFTVDKWSI